MCIFVAGRHGADDAVVFAGTCIMQQLLLFIFTSIQGSARTHVKSGATALLAWTFGN